MANPHPIPRWKPGKSGNPNGRPPGTRSRKSILAALPRVRSLEEVLADERAWRGNWREMFEAIARDPEQDLAVRLAAADRLLKIESEMPGAPRLTREQRDRRIAELLARLGPLQIEGQRAEAIEFAGETPARDQTSCDEATAWPEFQ